MDLRERGVGPCGLLEGLEGELGTPLQAVAVSPGLVRPRRVGMELVQPAQTRLREAKIGLTQPVQMLRLVGLYTVADSAQLVFTGALRGAGDTRWVMRTSVILHWVMATGAILLIRVVKAPPLAVWAFFIAFIITLGITMYLRFRGGKWMSMKVI